jgi:hypothetical protein
MTTHPMRQAVILILSLVSAAISFASPVDQLRSISHFAFGGVGVAGTTSEGPQKGLSLGGSECETRRVDAG